MPSRALLALLSATLIVLSLAACAPGTAPAPAAPPPPAPAATTAPAAPAAPAPAPTAAAAAPAAPAPSAAAAAPASAPTAAAAAAAKPAAPVEKEVVFTATGGTVETAWKAILSVFTQKTGIQTTYITATILEGLTRMQAHKEKPETDVTVVTDDGYAQFRKQGLFETLTPQSVPRLGEIFDALRYIENGGLPVFVLPTGIAYNEKIFKDKGFPAPTSIDDFWKTEYRNRVVVWTPSTTTGMLFLLLVAKANGGNESNVEPAWPKLKALAPYVSFNLADEMTPLMQQGQAWLGWWNQLRVSQVVTAGAPIKMVYPKEGTPVYTNGLVMAKGAPHPQAAMQLINWLLTDEGQLLIAEKLGGSPVIKGVSSKMDPKVAALVPSGESLAQGIYVANMDAVVANRAAWLEKWAKEIEAQ